MARIECPECESVIPAEVTFCPECGFAIKTGKVPDRSSAAPAGLPVVPLTMLDITKSIVGRLLIGAGMLATGIGFEAPPGVLLALAVWGSAIPLYLKARKAHRAGPLAGHRELEEAVRKQLTAARDATERQLASVDLNASRIAELEERIDFMERLVARERERS